MERAVVTLHLIAIHDSVTVFQRHTSASGSLNVSSTTGLPDASDLVSRHLIIVIHGDVQLSSHLVTLVKHAATLRLIGASKEYVSKCLQVFKHLRELDINLSELPSIPSRALGHRARPFTVRFQDCIGTSNLSPLTPSTIVLMLPLSEPLNNRFADSCVSLFMNGSDVVTDDSSNTRSKLENMHVRDLLGSCHLLTLVVNHAQFDCAVLRSIVGCDSQELSLFRCGLLDDVNLAPMAINEKLTSLEFGLSNVSDERLFWVLHAVPNLTLLKLPDRRITGSVLREVRDLNQLKHLDLSDSAFLCRKPVVCEGIEHVVVRASVAKGPALRACFPNAKVLAMVGW